MKLLINVLTEAINKNVDINEFDNLINEINSEFDKNIVIPKDVLTSFKLKKKLNDDIWENDTLKEKIRLNLLKIGKDFIKDLELSSDVKILDVLFTGSLANFNWSKFSDIDLHIVIDFKKVDSDDKIVKTLFDAKKNVWNKEHDITVYDYPVELYVQDKNESLAATAVFSVLKNKWLKKPNREEFKVPKKALQDKVKIFIEKLKDINNEYKDKNYKNVIKKSNSLKTKIRRMRKSGLEQSGEYSLENIIFKVLRRTNFIEELNILKSKAYDNLMSINEVKELPYDPRPEERLHHQKSLNSYANINNVRKVKQKIETAEKKSKIDEEYFNNPNDGNGYYQVEFKFDGQIKTKHIKPSGDMMQSDIKFTPSDIGTTRQFQNIALYCFVKAGKEINGKYSYLVSPADDAANKAMVIFKDEILSFYGEDKYIDDLAAKIAYEKMSDKDIRKKERKDLERLEREKLKKPIGFQKTTLTRNELIAQLGRPISPREYDEYKKTSIKPTK